MKILQCWWSCWRCFCWWLLNARANKRKCCSKRPKNKRGGSSQSILSRAQIRQAETRKLEERWKREGTLPVIPDFTVQTNINADLTDDSQPFQFLDIFLDSDLYMYLTTQTNLYATQYLGAHPDLPPHSHYRRCQPVSTTEMKQFLSVYLLTGIIKKPVIHQYWDTHPMLKTSSMIWCPEVAFSRS